MVRDLSASFRQLVIESGGFQASPSGSLLTYCRFCHLLVHFCKIRGEDFRRLGRSGAPCIESTNEIILGLYTCFFLTL